jgi:hypothetical protein
MLNVPKKANDAMHLSLLEGCDVTLDKLGEVILQDTFHVWDPKQIIRKGRERHIFLFELYLLFSKEVKDSSGKAKYLYKNKLMVSIRNRMSSMSLNFFWNCISIYNLFIDNIIKFLGKMFILFV